MITINAVPLSVSSVWGSIWPILVALLLFIIMIVIHEFGHFIIAKLMGVRVNEFSVGFGPVILKRKGPETEYSLRAIPFGGFCAMEGEDEESSDERAFCNKKAWKRFFIVAAGAVFNIVFGFIIMIAILLPQDLLTTTKIAKFTDNAVSVNYGLKEGDKIVKVNGRTILSTYDLSYALSAVPEGKVDIAVKRNGEKVELEDVVFESGTENDITYLKVDFYVVGEEKTFFNVISHAAVNTVSYARTVWFSLVDLISGRFGLSAVSGPVGVTAAIGEAARLGLDRLLPLICLITVNLGVFNLLPIPALDGGRLVFILFEMIFRRPVPTKYESVVHTVGFIIIFGFIILVTIKDVIGFF